MKSLFNSKVFWVAVIQAVASVVVVVFTELNLVGYLGVFKSVVDVILRILTEKPVTL